MVGSNKDKDKSYITSLFPTMWSDTLQVVWAMKVIYIVRLPDHSKVIVDEDV